MAVAATLPLAFVMIAGAHNRTKLGESPGYYVVWRGAGVHLSRPVAALAETTRCLSRQPAGVMRGST
jgi:hypothetical protein